MRKGGPPVLDTYEEAKLNFMISRLAKFARYSLLAISVLGIFWVLDGLYVMYRPQDALGVANGDCAQGELRAVPNGAGIVATSHVTSCSFGLAHGAETTYVYLHKSGEKDTADSLVFRFANAGNLYSPELVWTDSSTLHISVTELGEVTKQIADREGVKISYSIGKEDMSSEEDAKERKRDAEASFVWLIFLATICILTVWSIYKERAKTSEPPPRLHEG
jgi:hypothetical protein